MASAIRKPSKKELETSDREWEQIRAEARKSAEPSDYVDLSAVDVAALSGQDFRAAWNALGRSKSSLPYDTASTAQRIADAASEHE